MTRERYTLIRLLGSGNFGDVHLARHDGLRVERALKLVKVKTTLADALDEARKVAAVPAHDNIVKVNDAGLWEDGLVYIDSDVCSGGSLEDASRGTGLDPAAACRLLSDACRGLSHLHQHGLLHLDLRPANILLDELGQPRLVDFGLARLAASARVQDFYGPHAAPELVERRSATEATDIYALGMTLAHLLTGGTICDPYPEEDDLVRQSAAGTWPRIGDLGINVPSRVRKVIEVATQYDPAERPQNVDEFKRALDRATPAVAFVLQVDGSLRSMDGIWSIEFTVVGKLHSVLVKKNGRRRSADSGEFPNAKAARKHTVSLVKRFAEAG